MEPPFCGFRKNLKMAPKTPKLQYFLPELTLVRLLCEYELECMTIALVNFDNLVLPSDEVELLGNKWHF